MNTEGDNLWDATGLGDYVAIDLETTGLDDKTDRIIELGAVRFRRGGVVDTFSRLVNPGTGRLPREIVSLTGITDDDLAAAPHLENVADDYIDFVADLPIIGHNIPFDLGFLAEAEPTERHFTQASITPRAHDTNQIARFIFPCLDSYGLRHLSQLFKIERRPTHRAADDAHATGTLFALLIEQLSGVPLPQINRAFRFVEGTDSPLGNSLRAMQRALHSGFQPRIEVPDPISGTSARRTNSYRTTGDSRPSDPVTDRQIQRLFHDTDRFDDVIPKYTVRQEQSGMALSVAHTLREDKVLVVEAGTGVGKSLGYLAPALLCGERVAISTHTKNLQNQLFYDEIPRLGKLFKFSFHAVLLKGRQNYLCKTRWKNWAQNPERVTSVRLRQNAAMIVRWVDSTRTGDITEVSAPIHPERGGFFSLVVSEPGYCLGRNCNGKDECPYGRIRRLAQKAELVVINHSLAFADLDNERGIIGEIENIVFDEAHHIEGVATDYYGTDVSAPGAKNSLERLARVCRRGGELWVNLSAHKDFSGMVPQVERLADESNDLTGSVDRLFLALGELLRPRMPEDALYSSSFRYYPKDEIHEVLNRDGRALGGGLTAIVKRAAYLIQQLNEDEQEDIPSTVVQELQSAGDELATLADNLNMSLAADGENRVYWIEVPPEINRPVRVKSAPLDVSEMLANHLWTHFKAIILTSATLSTGTGPQGFSLIVNRLGLNRLEENRVLTCAFGSPFDYDANCLVGYPAYFPHPSEQSAEHVAEAASLIAELANKHRRNILCLFTSYSAMGNVHRRLDQALAGTDIELLLQGSRLGRDRLVNRFRRANGAVLLGTDSLWEGIDVPGNALEMVVIPKLPFAVPGDPVVAARIDKIRAEGRTPFWEYQLPSAVIRLRQGAGRLIRTVTDRGVVLVLDSRTVTKGYGKTFRGAMLGREMIYNSREELDDSIGKFFGA